MARPCRDVSLALPGADARDRVVAALGAQGFASHKVTKDGSVVMRRGRTGVGAAVEAASEIVPLWLLPGGRKHMFAFDIRVHIVTDTPAGCTLRLELARRASAPVVDQQFETALASLDAALESQGLTHTWSTLTDAARDRRR